MVCNDPDIEIEEGIKNPFLSLNYRETQG